MLEEESKQRQLKAYVCVHLQKCVNARHLQTDQASGKTMVYRPTPVFSTKIDIWTRRILKIVPLKHFPFEISWERTRLCFKLFRRQRTNVDDENDDDDDDDVLKFCADEKNFLILCKSWQKFGFFFSRLRKCFSIFAFFSVYCIKNDLAWNKNMIHNIDPSSNSISATDLQLGY